MTTPRTTLRSRLPWAVAGALALAGLAVPANLAGGAASAQPLAARACAPAKPPYAVGTTTVRVKSRGNKLSTTVAYPATSNGTDAKPVCRASRLVVAGHGSQGDGAAAARMHQYLVQAGYVVAAPTFPSTSAGYDFDGNTTDVSRTITKVHRLSAGDGLLSGRVKRKRVGYIGTSMGGIIGLHLVDRDGRDRRIKAVVAKAGTFFGGTLQGRGGPGLLMINGNDDATISYASARQTYRAAKRPKGLITLDGVGHDLNTGSDQILTIAPMGFFARFLRGKPNGLRQVENAAKDSKIATLARRW